MNRLLALPRTAASLIVKGYQLAVSPLLPNCCRFAPSCSHYALEALQRHGFWRGGYLTVARLLRCHPWARWGFDPVPQSFSFRPWRDHLDQRCQGHHGLGASQ